MFSTNQSSLAPRPYSLMSMMLGKMCPRHEHRARERERDLENLKEPRCVMQASAMFASQIFGVSATNS